MKIRPINKPPSSISDFIEIFVIRDETPSTNMIFKIFEPMKPEEPVNKILCTCFNDLF